MIQGVEIKKLQPIVDDRGRLMEILRTDDPIFTKFGQLYLTSVRPQVIKAWHYHKKQDDHFCCVQGTIKVVLYDMRKTSKSYEQINEYFIGTHNPIVLKIPSGVCHGFKCISSEEALVLNIPTRPYNKKDPDEFRYDVDNNDIPYDWRKKVDG